MAWTKAPAALVATFDAVLPGPPAERRTMFGYPCAFVGGHMFTGLFQDDLFVRLPAAEQDALLALAGARSFEPVAGRPMREYVVVPRALHGDPTLHEWIAKAFAYARALPRKVPSKKRRATITRSAAEPRSRKRSR